MAGTLIRPATITSKKTKAELRAASFEAVATLRASLRAGSPAAKIRAAMAVVQLATNLIENEKLEKRIQRLEQRILGTRRKCGQPPPSLSATQLKSRVAHLEQQVASGPCQ